MTYSCLHTHTSFCDGAADVETMCRAAFEKGFDSLGFSSHAPLTRKTGIKTNWHLSDERLDEYISTVLEARKNWEGKLAVYLGLEVDYIEGLSGPANPDIQNLPLDYIIGAVHYVRVPKNGELFTVDGPDEEFCRGLEGFDNDGMALSAAYYTAYNNMIRGGNCDILAHLDLVKKNNDRFGFLSPSDFRYKKMLTETADTIAAARSADSERNPVVEVNTGGINRGRTADPYPSLDGLRLLKERNIPLVITADAHAPDHLGGHYETAVKTMENAGYRTMLLFTGRQDGKAGWQEVPLE
ncbi:histidinol-phosphatase [Spirochaetia bacterium]|nr:histidinol-phosphatase [Spirochaetia bacterium]